jgi:hypothetical protein
LGLLSLSGFSCLSGLSGLSGPSEIGFTWSSVYAPQGRPC